MTQQLSRAAEGVRQIEESLDLLEPLLKNPDLSKYVRDRLSTICMELFGVVGSRANTTRLESAARSAVDFDFTALRQLLQRLIALPDEAMEAGLRHEAAGARQRLESARTLIETTECQLAQIEPVEIGLRFEMYVDRALADFLNLLKRDGQELAEIVRDAEAKLAPLDDGARAKLWAKITNELRFGGDDDDPWHSRLSAPESVVSRSFFDGAPPDMLAHRIATYLVEIRPRLVHTAFSTGARSVPFPPLSLSRVLASRPDADAVTSAESKLVGHVMLLAHIMRKRLHRRDDELAAALAIPEDSRLLHGEREQRVRDLVPDTGLAQVMIAELRGAARTLATIIGGVDDPEVGLLIRYKRGLEVGLPESRVDLLRRNEVSLQRRLCSFLIQHGAPALGTRFGQAETDVVTGSDMDPLVIEAKVFRSPPNPRDVEAAFTQLRTYMDQTAHGSRGALVFFNFSDAPIHASREILGGRIAVVAVNLPAVTPSRQDSYLEVRGGPPGGPVIEVLSVGARRRRQRASVRPRRRRGPRRSALPRGKQA